MTDPDTPVDNATRDAIFARLKQQPENTYCFDCSTRNPEWCSINLGIFICYACTSDHRNLGTHLSFVRSSLMDKWTSRQLMHMEQGGCKKARDFFRSHGVTGKVDYRSTCLLYTSPSPRDS